MNEQSPQKEINPNWPLDQKQNLADFYEKNKAEWELPKNSSEEKPPEPKEEPKAAERIVEEAGENASIPDQTQTEVKSESKLGMDPSLYGKNYVADMSGSDIERHQPDKEKLGDNKLEELEEKKKLGEAFNVKDKRDSSWLETPASPGSVEESYHVMVEPDGKKTSMDNSEFATSRKLTTEAEEKQREKIYQAEKEGTGFRVEDYRSEEAKKVFSFLNPEEKPEQTGIVSESTPVSESPAKSAGAEPKVESQEPTSVPITPEGNESNKEKLIIGPEEVKKAIASQIEGMAKLEKLNLSEIPEGLQLEAELNAGLSGGKISMSGKIVNAENGIAIRDLNIEARDYVRSIITEDLSRFTSAIKAYFEKQNKNKKPVSKIQIIGPNLEVEFENITRSKEGRKFNIGAKIKGWYGKLDNLTKRTVLAGVVEIKQPENITAEEEHKKSVRESVKNVEANSGAKILAEFSGTGVPEKKPNPALDQNRVPPRKGLESTVTAAAPESVSPVATPEPINPAAVPIEGIYLNPSVLKCEAKEGDSLWEILRKVLEEMFKSKK